MVAAGFHDGRLGQYMGLIYIIIHHEVLREILFDFSLTTDNLKKHNFLGFTSYEHLLCDTTLESVHHLFLYCRFNWDIFREYRLVWVTLGMVYTTAFGTFLVEEVGEHCFWFLL